MNVLNAITIPVEDRVYRLIPVRDSVRSPEDDEPIRVPFEDDDYDADLPIMHQGNRFYVTIYAPQQLIKHVVGYKGKMRKALEQNGAKVNIPSQDNSDGTITVSGSTKKIVSDTYHRIVDLIIRSRLKTESTHFVSLPVNSTEIQESFLKFKGEILEKYKGIRGIDASIFQKPAKLHVTVAVLVLLDERDKQNAIAILNKCRDNILKDLGEKEFVVQVKGLECMNDDPSEVDVLYGKVQELDDDNRLQLIADNIMNEYVNASLSRKQYDKVKLHITLMNTLFRKNLENNDDGDDSERITFDARPILRDYSDYDFGQIIISEIHISVRYTEASNGFYIAIHKLKLNS